MNRYLVVACITAALSLLSSGVLVALSFAASALKSGVPGVPWRDVYVAAFAVFVFMPIAFRRPVLGAGRCPAGYSPRRSLAFLAICGSVMGIFAAFTFLPFPAGPDNFSGVVESIVPPLRLFAMWMCGVTATAFPAWHNDPAWGAGNDVVPSLPRMAGRLVRQLTVRGTAK